MTTTPSEDATAAARRWLHDAFAYGDDDGPGEEMLQSLAALLASAEARGIERAAKVTEGLPIAFYASAMKAQIFKAIRALAQP